MSAPTIADRVRKIIAKQFGVAADKIDLPDTATLADLKADSLDVVEMAILLEAEFDVRIDDEEIATTGDVGQIIKYVEDRHGRR